MHRKSTILALAAATVLGLAVLNPSIASAKPGHGGGGFKGGGMHMGGGGFKHGGHIKHAGHFKPHFKHPHHWKYRHHVRIHRPIWYAAPVVYSSYAVARPVVAGPCTCLSKEYTPEGVVVFKDRCTNEMAMNPPPVMPQQTSAIEPQPQVAYQQQYVQPQPQVLQQPAVR
jgi:hypothetical protein